MKKTVKILVSFVFVAAIILIIGYYFLSIAPLGGPGLFDTAVYDHIKLAVYDPTPFNFKVAFIADQGIGENAVNVLQLIKNENAHMVLHQGDFDYEDNPDKWEDQINNVLGDNFPYFASIGNHDIAVWSQYQQKLKARLNKISTAQCVGDLGINSACAYKGLFFVLSGVGIAGVDHADYIKDQLVNTPSIWRICSWHKNQHLMQVGNKENEVGWGVYEECRKGGAIIATGHEHSYSRTHLMGNFETQSIASTDNTLFIEKGKTFAFVSGLGGKSIREQSDKLAVHDWWARIYTASQNANYGALFCMFNKSGVSNRTSCYFKDIDGKVIDEFDVVSNIK